MKNFLYLSLMLFILVSCSAMDDSPQAGAGKVYRACAEPRLESGFKFHNKAREYLKKYYLTRKESDLFFAWYAAEDSQYMAQTIARCPDKRNKHFHAAQNLYHKNAVLRRLISQNMRTDTQAEISELFLSDYRKIFARDIQ